MCLTAEAFALFLNMLAVPELTSEPGRIIIHAQARDTHWIAVEDTWCTRAPQLDQIDRFASLQAR
ncbi:hypothetical protein MWU54_06105 [Marivita sp. S6314]|uniref:hypothetical protein n=1 Tax=Marivita sp. S6314 TaxID=2926406 RepID=UPI001FF5B881|nr:hypothetical protein [Marivita sp. S6314]MCK0149586.1 hypothetical protein [Marivita sp. S6314]